MSPELTTLILGCLAAIGGLQSLPDIKGKAKFLQALFALGIAGQLITQYLQYDNAVGAKIDVERRTAYALGAYTRGDLELLKKIAENNPYMIGYRYFKNSEFASARIYFEDAIKQGTFVAPSYYLLGHMTRLEFTNWSNAWKYFDASIRHDKKYSPAYYGRAILHMQANKLDEALSDLKSSVQYGYGSQCVDLNNTHEINTVWKELAEYEEFKKIQEQCRTKYD